MFGFFFDSEKIYLILEYALGGELYKDLMDQPSRSYSEDRAANYIWQLCEALKFMHSKDIIHRDIKPENLLNCLGVIKIADFGWSVHAPSDRRKTMCGTLDYLPPEMVATRGEVYDKRVDIWSVGVLAYEFCYGRPPFESKTSESTYEKIRNVELEFPGSVSNEFKDFVSGCLQKHPDHRYTLQ